MEKDISIWNPIDNIPPDNQAVVNVESVVQRLDRQFAESPKLQAWDRVYNEERKRLLSLRDRVFTDATINGQIDTKLIERFIYESILRFIGGGDLVSESYFLAHIFYEIFYEFKDMARKTIVDSAQNMEKVGEYSMNYLFGYRQGDIMYNFFVSDFSDDDLDKIKQGVKRIYGIFYWSYHPNNMYAREDAVLDLLDVLMVMGIKLSIPEFLEHEKCEIGEGEVVGYYDDMEDGMNPGTLMPPGVVVGIRIRTAEEYWYRKEFDRDNIKFIGKGCFLKC